MGGLMSSADPRAPTLNHIDGSPSARANDWPESVRSPPL
jgi:hypothetical protein